jgi:hypothetical protein
MNLATHKKLGSLFKTVKGNPPALPAAGARNGAAIDRSPAGGIHYNGLTLYAASGAETGAPSARTLDAKIQDSADGSTGWADYIPPGQATVAAIPQITAANSEAEVDVDLSGAKRYVRVVETLAFTGGTAPTLGAQETVVLGGADRTPV